MINPLQQFSVLMIAYTYYEIDTRVIREAEAACAGGFRVDFLALRRPGFKPTEMIRGVNVIRLNQSKYRGGGRATYIFEYLKFFFRCLVKTTVLFFRHRYRAIHVNNMPDFLVFSTIIPRLFGTKVILDIHDPMPNTFVSKFGGKDGGLGYRILLLQERLSAAYSNRVITVHDPVKEGILLQHGLSSRSVEVIANFADADLFRLPDSYIVNGKIRCVFHGTILERSGLRILMNAIAGARHRDKLLVTIIGEGDFSEPLKELIATLGIGHIVEFDNRSYPAYSIPARITGCHVGLVPLEVSSATNYALPLKLLEYIALGLAVIAVRNAAIQYYLKEGDCIFYDPDDPSTLSAALDSLAEDPQLLIRYHNRSVALRGRFSWAGEKAKYINLLRQLTGSQSERGV